MDITYSVVKTFVQTSSGRIRPAWNVVDMKTGYIFDTFDRKADATAWIMKTQSFCIA